MRDIRQHVNLEADKVQETTGSRTQHPIFLFTHHTVQALDLIQHRYALYERLYPNRYADLITCFPVLLCCTELIVAYGLLLLLLLVDLHPIPSYL